MNHSIIQILIICAYIGVLFLISGYVKMRSAGSSENYVLAGRKMTTPLIMASIIGLAVGGASTIGVAEQADTHGLPAGILLHGALEPSSWGSLWQRSIAG